MEKQVCTSKLEIDTENKIKDTALVMFGNAIVEMSCKERGPKMPLIV